MAQNCSTRLYAVLYCLKRNYHGVQFLGQTKPPVSATFERQTDKIFTAMVQLPPVCQSDEQIDFIADKRSACQRLLSISDCHSCDNSLRQSNHN